MTRVPNSGQTTRTMVWAVVTLVGLCLGAVVALTLAAPPGEAGPIVVQVLSILAPTLAVMVTLRQVNNVQDKVDHVQDKVDTVAEDTHDLTNGMLGRTVRSGVAEVLHPDLVDPAAVDQVAEDLQVLEDRHADENGAS